MDLKYSSPKINRCGAITSKGTPCKLLASNEGRCRLHLKKSVDRSGSVTKRTMTQEQYYALWNRRQSSDNLTWQVPSLSIAGQAFLLSTAMNAATPNVNAIVISLVSAIVGLVSIHTMVKHRYFERNDAELLAAYERDRSGDGFAVLHNSERGGPVSNPAYKPPGSAANLWIWMVAGFVILALFICAQQAFGDVGDRSDESIVTKTDEAGNLNAISEKPGTGS